MGRSSTKSGGKSRIRFIMLEADLSEGDLSEVTSAIQNALKPKTPQVIVHRTEELEGRTIEAAEIGDDLDEMFDQDEADDQGSSSLLPI